MRLEIEKLARGQADEVLDFIEKREAAYRSSQQRENEAVQNHVSSLRPWNPKLKNFDEVYEYFSDDIPRLIASILSRTIRPVTRQEAVEISLRLDSFPTIRSTVRANLRVMYHHIVHATPPGKDKWNDFRHVIEASYCDVFITADMQQSAIEDINPNLEVHSFSDLLGSLPSQP